MKQILTGRSIDIVKSLSFEDGKTYRGYRQDIDPVIARVNRLRHKVNEATKLENRREWQHVGSIPMTMLVDWLKNNHYTMDQWARNEDGAKDKFLKHFMSRDYCRLHNNHITTKRESSQIVVPERIVRDGTKELRGPQD